MGADSPGEFNGTLIVTFSYLLDFPVEKQFMEKGWPESEQCYRNQPVF
jgi:hypothetical protein